MKSFFIMISLVSLNSAPLLAYYPYDGFVTPAEVTLTYTGISLIDTAGKQTQVASGTFPVTFKASDTDFALTDFASGSITLGRYVGIALAAQRTRSIKLSGFRYQGNSGSANSGDYLCTTGSATDGTGVVAQASATCSSPTTLTVNMDPSTTAASDMPTTFAYFPGVYCIETDKAKCQTGDTFIDAAVATNLKIGILLDLYNSVVICTTGVCSSAPRLSYGEFNSFATIGPPGAAVHLGYSSSGHVGDITLLFDSSKNLVYVNALSVGGDISGFCVGRGNSTVTAVPTGKSMGLYGTTLVGTYVTSGNGKVAVALSGSPDTSKENSLTWPALGMMLIDGVAQAAGSSATVSCVADTDTAALTALDSSLTSKLGFTYTAGAGTSGTSTFSIKKLVDSSGIFNISTCKGSTTSGCGTYY